MPCGGGDSGHVHRAWLACGAILTIRIPASSFLGASPAFDRERAEMKFVDNLRVSAKVALNSAVILILLLAAMAETLYGLLAAQGTFGQDRLLATPPKSRGAVVRKGRWGGKGGD